MSEKRNIVAQNDTPLSAKQLRAISAVLTSRTISEGCKKVAITRKQFHYWRKDPEFEKEFNRQRKVLADEAFQVLLLAAGDATNALAGLLASDNENVRRLAANDVLDHLLRMREHEDLERRITALEQAVAGVAK